ncbi:MAG: HD domain-containing protein [Paramuribaculum sp.]
MGETKLKINDIAGAYRSLLTETGQLFGDADRQSIKSMIRRYRSADSGGHTADIEGVDRLWRSLATAAELSRSIAPDRNMVSAILYFPLYQAGLATAADITAGAEADVATLVEGLAKVQELYSRHGVVASENFRNLMLTLARDIRVVIIMIVDRLVVMRAINHHPDEEMVRKTAMESNYLYAPLAHRLGLYKIKGELEDLSLKYTNREMFTRIATKLNATKRSRDAYIESFIRPVKEALERQGLKFEIKGRTKSIYSIWNKMMKQHNDVEQIYDLFAIRIILDVDREHEKSQCWTTYSIVTDMYQPNPTRLKDWLSVPKSNGYESLHITVLGPQDKWVEVQIRSRRMDEIAETGVAAHWKYKGIKSENDLDAWMNHVRDILEDADASPMGLMRNLNMDLYSKEVFVFTPRGDLYKLPLGATLLDFAFQIHSRLGCSCTGGRVNGRSCRINYKLKSGDTVEVLTSSTQQPKLDWLSMVVTTKARNKIRQAVNEISNRRAELAKEKLQRRFKNRKIETEESLMMKVIKKLGFKTVTEFYNAIADEQIDVNDVITTYESLEAPAESATETRSAEEFTYQGPAQEDTTGSSDDVLVIGDGVKGVNYKLAKCCNPIYGDDVFGFISSEGVIKIHRRQCPNAPHILERYPYRTINTRWSGKAGSHFVSTLSVVGTDDIGIVTNITSIITKESRSSLRSISIDSHDGLFHGYLVVGVESKRVLDDLIKKISTVKGVKNVQRTN